MHLLATVIGEYVFIEATMSMGLRNTCKLFEEDFMKAFIKGLVHHHPKLFSDKLGNLVDNYLDDIWFLADTADKNMLQMLIAEWWANWLGIELNTSNREPPRIETRHLGFSIHLKEKVITVTQKHRRRILAFFDRFLVTFRKDGRIKIKEIQKMLGLQIYISTAFRVARQFLTAVCDIFRITGNRQFFYPRRHRQLVISVVFDLNIGGGSLQPNLRWDLRTYWESCL